MIGKDWWGARPLAAFALCVGATTAHAQDPIFGGPGGGFENEYLIAQSDAEAARFLNQATFGATRAEIDALRQQSFETWIDTQFAAPATLARPFLEQLATTENLAGRALDQAQRVHRWFGTAATAPDQLRQKLAYALSQIVVVSDQDAALNDETIMMAEWNDLLVRNAFGNYRTLLSEATRSPMMGRYLTSLRNRKFELDPVFTQTGTPPAFTISSYGTQNSGTQPDENYAREVMQLFSVGLVMRNLDFSPLPGPVATYNQQMITTMARVFTGLGHACSGTRLVAGQPILRNCNCVGVACNFSTTNFFATPPRLTVTGQDDVAHPDRYEPLVCYPRYHDTGRDIDGFQLPGASPGTPPVNATLSPAASAMIPAGTPSDDKALTLAGAVLSTIAEINSGAPRDQAVNCQSGALNDTQRQQCLDYCDQSLANAVDVLFAEPNTAAMVARQLIQRFVTSNPSPAYIERVARVFDGNGGARGDLRATIKAVLLDAEARAEPASPSAGRVREPMLKLVHVWRSFGAVAADGRRWGVPNPERAYFQRPLGAPSVFNFYEPDYRQPGAIETAGLYSPEFQIINENTSTQTANDLFTRICTAYGGGGNNCSGAFVQPPSTGTGTNSDRAYIPPAVLDALPADPVALVEELNLRLMDGRMSGALPNAPSCSGNSGMKGTLYNLLQCGLSALGTSTDARRRRILYLIHLIAISPDYAAQR
ncbi:MAG TPA: DUF1800 family protein [Candidatus Saccharimonadia bacterium]|nr:DUF1800 family protein [Candidatus Saccharimonadia bacterium]